MSEELKSRLPVRDVARTAAVAAVGIACRYRVRATEGASPPRIEQVGRRDGSSACDHLLRELTEGVESVEQGASRRGSRQKSARTVGVDRCLRSRRVRLQDQRVAVIEVVSFADAVLFPCPHSVRPISRCQDRAEGGHPVLGVEGERRTFVGRRVSVAVVRVGCVLVRRVEGGVDSFEGRRIPRPVVNLIVRVASRPGGCLLRQL